MEKGRHFEVGLVTFLIFILLSSPIMTGRSAFNMAHAASEQTVEPEGAPNGQMVNDPYEQINRKIFAFNDWFYFYVLKPATRVYSAFCPTPVRESINNGFHNLIFPSRFINFVLQGKVDKAANETIRFVINSTLGLAGLFDFAQTQFRLENNETDFGLTLAHWGVGSNHFLMIPLLGPSNPRDFIGWGADSVMDPLFWMPTTWWVIFSAETGKYVNYTSLHGGEYEEMKKASLDPYIAARDAYIQYREHMISK
jgi:phospholipid-binding lipoprotein MlaA